MTSLQLQQHELFIVRKTVLILM